MSKALSYLLAARPDAMGHYFAFLKEASGCLDPKTRDLISVICKVEAQTEKGLKQYVKRALDDGCTANEVLDAMLMAFPTLGLTKIIWAIDVLMAAGIADFDLERLTGAGDGAGNEATADWHDLGPLKAIPEGRGTAYPVGTRSVFVFRDGETVKAWSDQCPHQDTMMLPSHLSGKTITCSKHNWVFDLATGACDGPGDMPLTGFDVKVEDGRVFVRIGT